MGNECMLGRLGGQKPGLHIGEKGAEAVGDHGESWTSEQQRNAGRGGGKWMGNQMTSKSDYKSCHIWCFILIIIKHIRIKIIIHVLTEERKHFPGLKSS